ncbi:hypothetical protein GGH12_003854 [Coemansia sp. RSA 1822]|nr:hypothetical protein LPJ76_003380 [Coemansia sp. RSA 638]KAJ2124671.1 hypothetical protein IW147_001636 [Coemansia sp. RSA 720]KAJ2541423.1 hypothetical protein GGF49_003668 [Coemansia sp. RSA 1853]KAJ2561601.1 hypothetical protein GGH12_003854 [Coemansia sp. RSA 1822]
MKFTTISVGLIATLSSANAGLVNLGSGQCAFNISNQLLNIVHLGKGQGNNAHCSNATGGAGGILAGFAGFSTQNGDALQVVEQFQKTAKYGGEFDSLLSTLKQCAADVSDSTKGLENFCDAWTKASVNPDFYASQVKVATEKFQVPTDKLIGELGIVNSLTKSILYDTALLDGVTDVTGVIGSLIQTTNLKFVTDTLGSSGNVLNLASGVKVDELKWILGFLDARQALNIVGDLGTIDLYRGILGQGILNFDKGGLLNLDLSSLKVSDTLKGVLVAAAGLVNNVEGSVNGVVDGAVGTVGGVVNAAGGLVNGVADTVNGVTGGILGGVLGGVVNTVGGVVNTVGGVVNDVVDTAQGAVSGVVNAAEGTVAGAVNAAGGVVDGVVDTVGGVAGGVVGGAANTVGGVVNTVGGLITINCSPLIQL